MSAAPAEPLLAQYQRLKTSCARVSGPAMARFTVTGRDAEAYLHRRLSQKIKGLAPGAGVHALQLGGDGRLECDLLVYRSDAGFEILAEASKAEPAAALAEKFTLMDDAAIERRWNAEDVVALAGPEAPARADALRPSPLGVFRDPRWRIPIVYLPFASGSSAELASALGPPIGEQVFEFARIEEGIPRFGIDTNSETIPLEAGMTDAIDFEKGCFPGQEVLAKIRNLGHPARQFVRLEIEGECQIASGSAISIAAAEDGANAGAVTSSATIPGLGRTLALGFVKWSFRGAAEARINTLAGDYPARMTRLFEWQETGFRTRP